MTIRRFRNGLALALALAPSPANSQEAGHTHAGAVGQFYQSWMQPDNRNVSCCHDQDCAPAMSRIRDGQLEAERNGKWFSVPAPKIELDRDSPDGRSHLCARDTWTGFTVFCFIRGISG